MEHLVQAPHTRHVCLFAQPINRIDATGADVFIKLCAQLRTHNIDLHISGLKLPVETTLHKAGWQGAGPSVRLYRTEAETLAALARLGPEPVDMAAAVI